MTIEELAKKAEVTVRTIRYYVEQGVLAPPGRGRPSEYTDAHLRQLSVIKSLKEQYLPLEEIRDTMQRLSLDDVEELLAQSSLVRKEAAPSSASDYIASVLSQNAVREQMKREAAPPPMRAAAPLPAATPPLAPAYARPRASEASSDQAAARADRAAGAVGLMAAPEQMEHTATWQRITLAPGIELHYVLTADARIKSIAAQIAEAAKDILDNYPREYMEEPK